MFVITSSSAVHGHLPFHGNRLKEGWLLADVTQIQGGNPLNVVTSSTLQRSFGKHPADIAGASPIVGIQTALSQLQHSLYRRNGMLDADGGLQLPYSSYRFWNHAAKLVDRTRLLGYRRVVAEDDTDC